MCIVHAIIFQKMLILFTIYIYNIVQYIFLKNILETKIIYTVLLRTKLHYKIKLKDKS